MANVSLEKVNKVYENGFHAVKDMSLDIADGEFMVLVGPSGCGKTTALRMVAGLEDITSGILRIGGKEANDETPKERDIAMVFQNYALYPHMTVAQNIGFALKLRKLPKAELDAKVKDAADILGLTDWLDRKPGQLSGGQRQRVAMGRAIVREPSVFLMDEPLSNLDAKLRVQMRAEVARIQRRMEVSTIYVTHDQVEAMTMGDRVTVMRDGTLQQVDTPQNLYDNPDNIFVAAFIGSPAQNLYDAIVGEGARSVKLGSQAVDAAGSRGHQAPGPARLRRQGRGGRHAARAPARGEPGDDRPEAGRRRGPGRGARLGTGRPLHHRRAPGHRRGRGRQGRGRGGEVRRGRGPRRGQDPGQAGRQDDLHGRRRGHAVLRHHRPGWPSGDRRNVSHSMPSAQAPPPWWHGAVIYQLYVRSWRDSDGDGYGDLRGIIERLDHLAWLGVDAVWLSPTMPSPGRGLGLRRQ